MKSSQLILSLASVIFCALVSISCHSITPQKKDSTISDLVAAPRHNIALKNRSPRLLNTKELTVLLRKNGQNTQAARQARKLFESPFVDNSQYNKYGLPKVTNIPTLGPSLRVSTWNIEKSIHVKEAAEALKSEKAFVANLRPEVLTNEDLYKNALRQRADIANSDILLLQEMDIGHCRSDYTFAAKFLATKLGMNFVYAPQQLEIDPDYLRVTDMKFENDANNKAPCGDLSKYHGVFGVAVLSKYPIKRVQVFPLKNQPYDWYEGEIQAPDIVEKSRRFGAKQLFDVQPAREIKNGGRGFTRVDLHVPGVLHETISVINIHLEIKAKPENRTEQIEEILSYINDIENPVIMAGDFNSASRDVSSTSISRAASRAAQNPTNLLSIGLFLANTTGLNQLRGVINGYKNFQNPLAWNIPVILPNKTKSLFKLVEDYRFKDGGAFDFRGNKERSLHGHTGILSNSNQRNAVKGFVQTFALPNTIGPLGCERLDWIFVKSHLKGSRERNGSYKLAPHFGETLDQINYSVKKPYSDHHPITTVLPLNEPSL